MRTRSAVQFPICGSSAAQNCVWRATSLAVPVDTAWYVTEAPDRERILIAAVVDVGIGKSKRPSCSCVTLTESRCPRRMVNEAGEMSPAQDPDLIAAWPGAENVYGVPHVVTFGEVCVLLPQSAIVSSASSPTSNRSARITANNHGRNCSPDQEAAALAAPTGVWLVADPATSFRLPLAAPADEKRKPQPRAKAVRSYARVCVSRAHGATSHF